MLISSRRQLLVTLLLLALPSMARGAVDGEGKGKSTLAVRTSTPPVIDGRLDDSAWADAPVDGRFSQLYPDEGKAPSETTEVRVLYDDRAIYVAVRMNDA